MIRLRPRMPAAARDRHALGVMRIDTARMASGMPGASFSQTAIVASHGGIAYLHGDGRIVTAISDAALHFAAHEVADTQYVSVFAHSDSVRDVTERGLKYRLDHATLSNLQVNGLSNEFIDGDAAQIAVGGGIAIIVFDDRAPLPELVGATPHGTLGEPSTHVTDALA